MSKRACSKMQWHVEHDRVPSHAPSSSTSFSRATSRMLHALGCTHKERADWQTSSKQIHLRGAGAYLSPILALILISAPEGSTMVMDTFPDPPEKQPLAPAVHPAWTGERIQAPLENAERVERALMWRRGANLAKALVLVAIETVAILSTELCIVKRKPLLVFI